MSVANGAYNPGDGSYLILYTVSSSSSVQLVNTIDQSSGLHLGPRDDYVLTIIPGTDNESLHTTDSTVQQYLRSFCCIQK